MLSPDARKKLLQITEEKKQIETDLSTPEIASDMEQLKTLSRRLAEIRETAETFSSYLSWEKSLEEAKEMKSDPEMRELAQEEIEHAESEITGLEEELRKLLIPKDPNASKDCILEIRPGAGGDESCLFAEELSRSYLRFCEQKKFTVEIMNRQENESGGLKEFIMEIRGQGAYGTFTFEGGVHRVQRIPKTESQGRVHTSAVSVVVMPKMEEKEFQVLESDLRIDTFRASGPGGQSVNTTDSAIRITHIPTGVIASCQDQKSQLKNKLKALGVLRSRLASLEEEKKAKELGSKRLSQIGSGDRSDKIRTYNFPQDRVTDHRIKKSFSNLPSIMDGNLESVVESLQEAERLLRMTEG